MEKKPLVVVNGLVRKDAIAYLKEHVDVRQWTEKTVMPREVLKEWLVDADGLWCVRPLDVDADLVKNAPNLKVIAQAAVGYDNVNIDELTAAGIPSRAARRSRAPPQDASSRFSACRECCRLRRRGPCLPCAASSNRRARQAPICRAAGSR